MGQRFSDEQMSQLVTLTTRCHTARSHIVRSQMRSEQGMCIHHSPIPLIRCVSQISYIYLGTVNSKCKPVQQLKGSYLKLK